jgi:predicted dehydrogenase
MRKKVCIGIVGARFAAKFHLEAYQSIPGVEVIVKGVTSRTKETREEFVKRYRLQKAYENLDEMLEDPELDAIDLCVENKLHLPFALKIAQAKKDIICEKPLTGYFGEGWQGKLPIGDHVARKVMLRKALENTAQLSEAIKKSGVKFMYAENWVYAPAVQKINRLIEASITSVNNQILKIWGEESHSGSHAEYYGDWARSGGGSLMGKGCHPLGAILFLKYREGIKKHGQPFRPVKVGAYTDKLYKLLPSNYRGAIKKDIYKDIEDHSLVKIRFSDGSIAIIEASENVLGGVQSRLEVYTAYGRLSCNFLHNDSLKVYTPDAKTWGDEYLTEKLETRAGWCFPSPDENWFNGYVQELTDFVYCILDRDREPLSNFMLAQDTVAVIYTAYLSAEDGGREKEICLD